MKKIYNVRPLEQQFRYAQAVRSDNKLYVSGTVSWDMDGNPLHPGDMRGQVRVVYDDLAKTLRDNGTSFAKVVKETIYTTNIEDLAEANDIRSPYYPENSPPASTWVEIRRLVHPDFLLEVELIAEVE